MTLFLFQENGGNNVCWHKFKCRFNEVVRDVIRFAKKVPGFTSLDLDDQVGLIKGGCFEVCKVDTCICMTLPEYTPLPYRGFMSANTGRILGQDDM